MIEINKNMLNNLLENGCYKKDGIIKSSEYTIEEMYLVRTTDIFPFDKKIKSVSYDNAIFKSDSFIFNEFLNSYSKDIKNCCQVAYNGCRTTIHFCLNGLVGNHAYGYFSERKFLIIEPFKYHVQDSNLISLRSEDTYFKDYLNLCDPIIIMSKKNYNDLIDECFSELTNYKIITYDFTKEQIEEMYPIPFGFNNDYSQIFFEQDIVKCVLQLVGAPYFTISSHGFSDTTNSQTMNKLISNIRQEYSLGFSQHFNSQIHQEDGYKNIKNSIESDIEHFIYVVTNSDLDQSLIDQLLYFVPFLQNEENYNGNYLFNILRYKDQIITKSLLDSKLKEFIEKIKIEKFIELTKQYNTKFNVSKKVER